MASTLCLLHPSTVYMYFMENVLSVAKGYKLVVPHLGMVHGGGWVGGTCVDPSGFTVYIASVHFPYTMPKWGTIFTCIPVCG